MKELRMKCIVMIAGLILAGNVYGQYKVSGRVLNEQTNMPLEVANIILSTPDSVYVTGSTANLEGYFEIKNVASGNYLLTTSYMGYVSRVIVLNGLSKSLDLGDILMNEEVNLLDGVTVTGSTVTNRTDRLIVFVTDQQKSVSSNGINILTAMQLPRLTVNPLTNEVSLPGEEKVQFCINGVTVESKDIIAIQPREIIRIEYLDNPGVRYGNADVVINYILKREVAGGSVSMDLSNALTTSFGNDQVAAKFNYKKSEFGINYSVHYRNPSDMLTDQEHDFHFADGSVLKRFDKGHPGDISENFHNFSLNYNLLEDNKYYFNATVRHSIQDNDRMSFFDQTNSWYPDNITKVRQGANTSQKLPSLDLYYMRTLKNQQTLIFNAVGTYIDSRINQRYEEVMNDELITDIVSDVDGEKYSVIGEGIYEKVFKNSNRLTAGLKHTQAFANNKYMGDVNSRTKMDQTDTYLYAEYAGRKDKFSYTGGVGVSRTWIKQENQENYTSYVFRPKVTLQYNFTPAMFLRLRGEIYNTSPSLSALSSVAQYIDTLQIKQGNPALKQNLNYNTNLFFNWRKGVYNLSFNTSYIYSPKPIMESIFRQDDMFISTFDNHRSWQKLNSEVTINGGPIAKFLMFSLTGGVNRYISKGNTYTHTLTNFYYRAQVMAMYKKFMAIFQAGSAYDRLSGETLEEGENMHLFMLNYNGGKYSIGAGIMYPFSSQYKRNAEVMNAYAPTRIHMYGNDFSRMVLIKFAWNFDFGRKTKTVQKRINNSDNDAGILTGK